MPDPVEPAAILRWPAKLGLLALSMLLLSLSLAPVYQFYLAWIGLVPWFFVIASTRTKKAAFFWSWLGGTLFFGANMWWLWKVTIPGMFALLIYLGLFFGFVAWILVGCRLISRQSDQRPRDQLPHNRRPAFNPAISIPLIAIVFTALEWVRGNWSIFGNTGLPWLNLGNTQSPFLLMCQVADFGGVYAVTFWVVLVNAMLFYALRERNDLRRLIPATTTVFALIAAAAVYGAVRMANVPTVAGPTVLVIQPNYKQSNETGEKGAPLDEIVRFHVATTKAALFDCQNKGIRVDLIAWSETMMPALNPSMRQVTRGLPFGELVQSAYDQIASLADDSGAAMIVGGAYSDDWHVRNGDELVCADRRNSAYFVEPEGLFSDKRYDKIHLVPFGEFIPYNSIPFIHALLMKLGPSGYEDYVLTPGDENAMTVFEVSNQPHAPRFVVPICFEDIVGPLCAKMVRGPEGTKRADFLVNLTNDGWFMGGQMSQHLQAAVFRSIENRVPTARAVNTGVSGFIDSTGRVFKTVKADTEGWSVAQLKLDSRVTFYTNNGDLFVQICAAITSIVIVAGIFRTRSQPKGLIL